MNGRSNVRILQESSRGQMTITIPPYLKRDLGLEKGTPARIQGWVKKRGAEIISRAPRVITLEFGKTNDETWEEF